ncbi:MAG: glycosyltransferase family 2 protein [Thermoanaerobaculia bacterium]
MRHPSIESEPESNGSEDTSVRPASRSQIAGRGSQGYDIVIPARDEAPTIAAVIEAAYRATHVARVIVVDDGSTDETASVARTAGAEVVRSKGNGSKALALATGVAASTAPVLVFFDADILAARPEHFLLLAAPVLEGQTMMCCGLVDYGWRNAFYMRLPPITGLRAVRREVFEAIPQSKLNGFQIEIMINEVIARAGMPSAIRVLPGIGHRSKVEKLGFWRGTRARIAMTGELLHCLTFVPLWTYGSYLRNLTVLKSNAT